jgi:hypothetical protein
MMNKSLRECGRESSRSCRQSRDMVSSGMLRSSANDENPTLTANKRKKAKKKSRRFRRL